MTDDEKFAMAARVLDDVQARIADAIADRQQSLVVDVAELKLIHGLAEQMLQISRPPAPEIAACPIDLLVPLLQHSPNLHELWVFADDAAASRCANPVVYYRSGIAVARTVGHHASRGNHDLKEAIYAARLLKGDGWPSNRTYGILVGDRLRPDHEAVKILVMQWNAGRWTPYCDGLVSWLKEVLLEEVTRRSREDAMAVRNLRARGSA